MLLLSSRKTQNTQQGVEAGRGPLDGLLSILEPIADPLDCKLIAVLAAEGLSGRDIAERLEVTQEQVDRVLRLPTTTKLMFKYQSVLRFTPEQQIEAALPRAVEKKIYLMMHAQDEKVQSSNATEIIDRARGKPVQTTIVGRMGGGIDDVKQVDANLTALDERLAKLEGQKKQLLESRGAVIEVPSS